MVILIMLAVPAERQRSGVARPPPRTPNSSNTVNVAPNTQRLIDTAATFLEALDAPNVSSSSIQTSLLRAFLRGAKKSLTALQQEPTPQSATNAILREVQAVHQAVKGLATPPASPPTSPRPTWAQIATALAPTPPRRLTPLPQLRAPNPPSASLNLKKERPRT